MLAGSLIKLARIRAGWISQRDLARRAGVAQSVISAYEAGRRQPSLPSLLKILRAAGFDLLAEIAPHDDHDESVRAWEAAQPPEVRTELEAERRRFSDPERRGRVRVCGARP